MDISDAAGCSSLGRKGRQQIETLQQHCDPVALLETIRSNQSAHVNGEQEPAGVMEPSDSNKELPAAAVAAGRTSQARRLASAHPDLPHAGGSNAELLALGVAVAHGRSDAHRPAGHAATGERTT